MLGSARPKTGNIFLVLDVTITNNDKNEDFDYSDASFSLYDATVQKSITPITSTTIVGGALSNPLKSGKVPMKSSTTGQIVFGVRDSPDTYSFTVYDSKGNQVATFNPISVS